MTRTKVLQEIRRMRFEEACGGWQERRLTQEEPARLLGVCERMFRRYEDEGLDGLGGHALRVQVSARRAPVDEVVRTEALYQERYDGWNVKHFYSFYQREPAGTRSYTWVKNTLQRAGLVAKASPPCPHSCASRPQAPQEQQPAIQVNRTTLVLQDRTALFVANIRAGPGVEHRAPPTVYRSRAPAPRERPWTMPATAAKSWTTKSGPSSSIGSDR